MQKKSHKPQINCTYKSLPTCCFTIFSFSIIYVLILYTVYDVSISVIYYYYDTPLLLLEHVFRVIVLSSGFL